MPRAPVKAAELSDLVGELLHSISKGSAQVQIGSTPLATLDAGSRSLEIQIGPLLDEPTPLRRARREAGLSGLWKGRSIPSELARRGWRLTISDGTDELLALGRGTSALLGHMHVTPTGLWKLRKLI